MASYRELTAAQKSTILRMVNEGTTYKKVSETIGVPYYVVCNYMKWEGCNYGAKDYRRTDGISIISLVKEGYCKGDISEMLHISLDECERRFREEMFYERLRKRAK